jgi:hypothetical protein
MRTTMRENLDYIAASKLYAKYGDKILIYLLFYLRARFLIYRAGH